MRPSVGIGVLVCASTLTFVGLAGILAGSGCTVLTNDGLPDDAGKFDGETDAATPVCGACLAQECTGQWATCFGDPPCIAAAKRASAAACVAPDSGTDDGGDDGGADPLAVYAAFTSCNDAKAGSGGACATDCAGTTLPGACAEADSGTTNDAGDASDDGASADASTDGAADAEATDAGDADAGTDAGPTTNPSPGVDTCTACVSGECGDAKKKCAIGTECAAYLECVFAAADAAAAEQCGAQYATGKAAATELATCTRVGCSNACGF